MLTRQSALYNSKQVKIDKKKQKLTSFIVHVILKGKDGEEAKYIGESDKNDCSKKDKDNSQNHPDSVFWKMYEEELKEYVNKKIVRIETDCKEFPCMKSKGGGCLFKVRDEVKRIFNDNTSIRSFEWASSKFIDYNSSSSKEDLEDIIHSLNQTSSDKYTWGWDVPI